MKNESKINYIIIALLILITSGCALYGNERQYEQGDWYWVATSEEVARIKQDKLALEKVTAIPAQTAQISSGKLIPSNQSGVQKAPAGFRGKVVNLDKYDKIYFEIKGPEVKGYLLGPGQSVIDYLIPGKYKARISTTSRYKYTTLGTFNVNSRTHNFMGEEMHWYVYYEY